LFCCNVNETPPPADFGKVDFMDCKSRFVRIIGNYFTTTGWREQNIFLLMSNKLFTIVDITVVFPVPAYPFNTRWFIVCLVKKIAIFLKKISLYRWVEKEFFL
jgi:hypothetical protein